eukprot:scaffold7277_cov62-Phaeocystis_antarctica.AAC.3
MLQPPTTTNNNNTLIGVSLSSCVYPQFATRLADAVDVKLPVCHQACSRSQRRRRPRSAAVAVARPLQIPPAPPLQPAEPEGQGAGVARSDAARRATHSSLAISTETI